MGVEDEALARMEARLERVESALGRVVDLLDRIPPNLAIAADMADEWAQKRGGDALEGRLASVERALLGLTEPHTLDALVRVAGLAPRLEAVAGLAAGFEDHVAIATDIADAWVRERLGGDGAERVLEAVTRLADPAVLTAVAEITALAPGLVRTATVASELDAWVAGVSQALREPAAPVGVWGLLGALSDPEIQRGLGRALHIARHLGRHDSLLPAPL